MFEYVLKPYFRYLNGNQMHMHASKSAKTPIPEAGKRYLLYVHVPFCRSLCPFCVFHRMKLKQPSADRYFDALRREIRTYTDSGFQFDDIYVGGGTPTVIPDQLVQTLELITSLHDVERISVETNPSDLTPETIDKLLAAGVNRVSVGVQSFDDVLLREMGRYASYGSSEQIISRLKAAYGRFDTLNVDMIFNQPHQSFDSLRRDIDILTNNDVADQVSFYPIMPAANVSRSMRESMGTITLRNERRMYRMIVNGMQPAYRPSTAWCFSRGAQMVDEYIVDHEEYIGAGSGAFSYIAGCFYSSSFSVNRYIDAANSGRSGIVMSRELGEFERMRYRLLVGLFGLELDWAEFCRDLGSGRSQALWKERWFFSLLGSIRREGDRYRLTERGMYHWVVMMREFLTGVDNFRAEMRSHIRKERSSASAAAETLV